MSSLNDFSIINPYIDKDMKLVRDFDNDIYNSLNEIRNSISQEEYDNIRNMDIITRIYLAEIKEDRITNFITIEKERDTKTARVYPIIKNYEKDIIPKICAELINKDEMEVVFTMVTGNDKKTLKNLLDNEFTPVSVDDNNYYTFMEEKNIEKEKSSSWK